MSESRYMKGSKGVWTKIHEDWVPVISLWELNNEQAGWDLKLDGERRIHLWRSMVGEWLLSDSDHEGNNPLWDGRKDYSENWGRVKEDDARFLLSLSSEEVGEQLASAYGKVG